MICQICVFCILVIIVNATPNCVFDGALRRDIVCKPGQANYQLKRGLVSEHDGVTGITLRGCRISDVELESFHQLPALEYLDLSKNQIQNLQLGVLDDLKELKLLNLSYNQLTTFPLGLFDEMPLLVVLDLKGNKLNNLELGIFDQIKRLKHVDLSSNAIIGKDMNIYLFDQSTQINFMDFSRNDMSKSNENLLQAFQAMDFLNLDRCFLTEVPAFITKDNLKTMKHLMLSTNKITRLDNPTAFVNLENLEILNFVDNSIEYIAAKVFTPLKNIKSILLTNNKLKDIPDTLFQHLPKLGNLDLSYNVLETVPVDAFRGSPIKNLNLAGNRFSYLTNNFCLELKNSGGKLTKFYFNQNPWQCSCLRDILDEVKTLSIAYNDVKYDGRQPVCVTSNEFHCKRQPGINNYYIDLYYNSINGL